MDENNPTHMNALMALAKDIAKKSNVALMLMAHTTKAGSDRQEDRIGNMDIFRGSSAVVYKARFNFTMLNASDRDVDEYNIRPEERQLWVRLDNAKLNLAAPSNEPLWFRRHGVKIANGDEVGVIQHQVIARDAMFLKLRIANILIDAMMENGAGSMGIGIAANLVRGGEPIMANKKESEVRQRIEAMFTMPCMLREKTLRVIRTSNDKMSDKVVVTLT